jgi:zona occludens toxin
MSDAKITLVTGVPGSGKTALAVDLLLKEFQGRPLYVDGLNGLKLDHVPIDVMKWPEEVEDGGVIVVDEVQRKWRPRGPGAKVPESVAALETHRHRGIDIVVITQNPRLVDSNVRNLVGRHLHVRNTGVMGRWLYEWPEVSVDCAWKSCLNKRKYRLPKRVFGLYKSASVHFKHNQSIPLVAYGAAIALVAVAVLGGRVYKQFSQPKETEQVEASESKKRQLADYVPSVSASASKASAGPVDERVDFIPRISGRPWTAPAYDDIRKVVQVPHIAGAMCIGDDCRCYSADGGRLHDVGARDCREWLERDAFNPYRVRVHGTPSGDTRSSASPSESSETQGAVGDHPASLAS